MESYVEDSDNVALGAGPSIITYSESVKKWEKFLCIIWKTAGNFKNQKLLLIFFFKSVLSFGYFPLNLWVTYMTDFCVHRWKKTARRLILHVLVYHTDICTHLYIRIVILWLSASTVQARTLHHFLIFRLTPLFSTSPITKWV